MKYIASQVAFRGNLNVSPFIDLILILFIIYFLSPVLLLKQFCSLYPASIAN